MIRSILLPILLAATACSPVSQPAPTPTPEPVQAAEAKLLTWADLTARQRPAADAAIAYGDAPNQKVTVWLPAGPKPYKTVLMVHGGCWTTSIADQTLMDWIASDLRDHGYAVWNIDYRGVDVGGGYPGTFSDAAAAADALRANAERFGLNTDRIVAVGHSAGGHLALWLAGREKLPADSPLAMLNPLEIAHVVSLGGLPDLQETANTPENGCGTDVVNALVAGADPADRWRDTSVDRLLPLVVPQDHVAGLQDRIIPLKLKEDFVAKAKAAGDDATLHRIDRTGHVELIAPESAAWKRTRELIDAAFAK